MLQPKPRSNRVTLGIEIAGKHSSPGLPGERSQKNSNRSLTDDKHRLVRLEIEELNRLIAGIHRLDEGRLLERNLIRNLHQSAAHDPIHHANVLREAATRRRKASGTADLLVHLALRERLLAAVETLATGDVMVGHHPIADCKAGDALANLRNCPRHLMSEDARSIVRTGVNLLQVGSADTAGVDLDQHLACANLGDGNRLDTYIVCAAIDGGAHGCGNCVALLLCTQCLPQTLCL